MKQFMNTFMNCVRLRNFSVFKMLYNEVPIPVYQVNRHIYAYAGGRLTCSGIDFHIKVGTFDTSIDKDTALLHEIGHYIDYMNVKLPKRFRYVCSNNNIKNKEKQAWKHGIRLSEKYNIPIDYVFAKRCLSTYKTEYAIINNRISNE